MPTPNQIFKRREDVSVSAMDLLNMNMPGTVTEQGIRKNIEIGLGYMEGWLRAVGCVPLNYLMEDAATAEVSRSQVWPFPSLISWLRSDTRKLWQWAKHGVLTAESKRVTKEYNLQLLREATEKLVSKAPAGNKYRLAARYFETQVTGEEYADFLTSLLYNEIVTVGGTAAKL